MARAGETTSLVAREATPENTLLTAKFAAFVSRIFPSYSKHASLQKAYHYFEHNVLPRRVVQEGGTYQKAPMGYKGESSLYPAWTTTRHELKDFGIGVAVYFDTLLALAVILLVAGLLYLPTILYYGSDSYTSERIEGLDASLRGSLICPAPRWVPCADCTLEEWTSAPDRIGKDETGLIFVLKNHCAPLLWKQGVNHLVVMTFVTMGVFYLGFYQRSLERHYDESVLTASDYSIQVDNPPEDATDPDEWKEFFQQFGPVTHVTVALNNNDLLEAITRRRVLLQKAKFRIEDDSTTNIKLLHTNPEILKETNPGLYRKLLEVDQECKQLLGLKYPTSAVFVTFEKELAQRTAIRTLQVGQINVVNNTVESLEEQFRFRGSLVLDVFEAPEPSAIRWQDLDETMCQKIYERIVTTVLTLLIIICGFWFVEHAYQQNLAVAATGITVLNIIVPNLFKLINTFESHQSEGSYQASLYWKISVFRWINTAIVTIIIKPFTQTLSSSNDGLVVSIHALLRAEIIIPPILHMLDIVGHLKRQLLAPRALNQAAMNSYFRGSKQFLGEKYTNATKTLFLVFFYSAIFPAGFFFGSIALFVTYFTDKFLLLRSWGPMPQVGDEVARLSRKIFFPLTAVALAVASEFFYSAYPCDNICDTDTLISQNHEPDFLGFHVVTSAGSWHTANVTVSSGDTLYRFCDQDFLERFGSLINFFFEERDDWMAGDQEVMVFVFGLFAVGIIVTMLVINARFDLKEVQDEALGGFETEERDSGESFSDQPHVEAYIPQIPNRNFAFPLIASNIACFDGKYLGWLDPILGHEFYNMADDVKSLSYNGNTPVLSQVRQYC